MGFCKEQHSSLMDIAADTATVQPEFTEKSHPHLPPTKCDQTVSASADQPAAHNPCGTAQMPPDNDATCMIS